MKTHRSSTLVSTTLAVVALGVFHIARPLAVSAQSQADMTVSARVVEADAAWAGLDLTHTMLEALAGPAAPGETISTTPRALPGGTRPAASHGLRIERDGTVAWAERMPAAVERMRVTIAHLGS